MVSGTEASSLNVLELTFLFGLTVLEIPGDGRRHTTSLALGACTACGVVGLSQQLAARRHLITASAVAGGSSSNKVRGLWHFQASPHEHTEKADQTVILQGWTSCFCQVTKTNFAKCSGVKPRWCSEHFDFNFKKQTRDLATN